MGVIFGEVGFDEDVVEVWWTVHAHDWFVEANALSVPFPVVEMADGGSVSSVDGTGGKVGRVVTDVNDGFDAAGFGGSFPCGCLVVGYVSEGLDEEGGDVVVCVSSLAEVCVEVFDVVVSHVGVAVQVVEAVELSEDEALEG